MFNNFFINKPPTLPLISNIPLQLQLFRKNMCIPNNNIPIQQNTTQIRILHYILSKRVWAGFQVTAKSFDYCVRQGRFGGKVYCWRRVWWWVRGLWEVVWGSLLFFLLELLPEAGEEVGHFFWIFWGEFFGLNRMISNIVLGGLPVSWSL